MAKLRGAKKAAFLRRMAAGRRKAGRGSRRVVRKRRRNGLNVYNPARPRRRVKRMSFRRRRNPTTIVANPGYSRAFAAGWDNVFGAKKARRKKRKGSSMAKRRRKKSRRASARRASPRRRRVHRRRPASRRRVARRRRGGGGGFARVKRGTKVIYINGRRRRGRGRRRRNPGMGGLFKRAFVPYAVGFITAGAMGVVDSALSSSPMVKNLAKVGLALGVAAFAGRRYPTASIAAISAIASSQGYALGTRLAGGMVASSPAEAVKGLGDMAVHYPELGALLNGGVGALLNGPPDVDDAVVNYATALNNMADDDY
jgi:hypothetical protein